MPGWWRRWGWLAAFAAVCTAAWLTQIRHELTDFTVYRTAGLRALEAEPLYRESDGHYQFKYLPAFALAMAPVSRLPEAAARPFWFALSAGLLVVFVRLSLAALPDRRRPGPPIVWLTILFMAKFYAHELTLGQTNILLGVLLVGGLRQLQGGSPITAGLLAGAAVFVKPYALIVLPWLVAAGGARAGVAAGAVIAAGLLLPVATWGWDGNLDLLGAWISTVSASTAPNLLGNDNVSLAAMWARWLAPGPAAGWLAVASTAALLLFAAAAWYQGRTLRSAAYFEGALLLTLIPLVSPQGWDYTLLLATPAVMLMIDRWRDITPQWRALAAVSLAGLGLTIYDVLGRDLYMAFMAASGISLVVLCGILPVLAHLRWRQLA